MLLASASLLVLLSGSTNLSAQTVDPATTRPAEGIVEPAASLYALENARVVVAPDQILPRATVIVDRDSIVAVGVDIAVPAGAEVISLDGKTIYAGLVDTGGEADPTTTQPNSAHWNRMVTPDRKPSVPAILGQPDGNDAPYAGAKSLREQGITTQLIAPRDGIFSGESHVALTGGPAWMSPVLKDSVAQHLQLTVPRRGGGGDFPTSPMGAVALVRQTIIDAIWYQQAILASQSDRKVSAPVFDPSLQKIAAAIESQFFIVDCPNERFVARADKIAREFSFKAVLKGSGREYQLLENVVAANRMLLLPVAFPKPPNVASSQAADEVTLTELMHWRLAPENPARLAEAGVRFTLTTAGLEKTSDFLPSVRKAVKRGLAPQVALAALTTEPARLIGLDERIGTVASGKLANLIIVDGDLFDDQARLVETWVAGRRYRHLVETTPDDRLRSLGGPWTVTLSPAKNGISQLRLAIDYKDGQPDKSPQIEAALSIPAAKKSQKRKSTDGDDADSGKGKEKQAAQTAKLEELIVQRDRLTATIDVAKLSDVLPVGFAPVTILIATADAETPDGDLQLDGQIVWPDGETGRLSFARAKAAAKDSADKDSSNDPPKANDDSLKSLAGLHVPLMRPLGASGFVGIPDQPATVIFAGATIWTCGPEGILPESDIVVRAGKIAEVGSGLVKKYTQATDWDGQVIDAQGMHITPGLIDCHSHIATDGGVNEASRAVTADVRISDFIDHSDIAIYRQLAGGLTTSNILHGSANPIGGQNQVIKLRWGSDPDGLKFDSAPQGVKFALGENVKRGTWRDGSGARYPQSRMGVEQLLRDRFIAARQYDQMWRDWRAGPQNQLPPRRDLRLEAIAEVLRGERWVHCHSYRQDEIAALFGVLQEFNVQIGTLQHILEGYKVAEVLAETQAMASTFADWWAYKVEVYDAIPYNAALLNDRGIVVSMNSDDAELGRHLNTEAAKAIRYGGAGDEDALKMVTLNPAKQLRIEERVGSIEVGKDADLVLWSGRPMATTSRCEQTWIDGRPYFTRQADADRRQRDSALRAELIQAVFAEKKQPTVPAPKSDAKSGQADGPGDGLLVDQSDRAGRPVAEEDRWPRIDIYCAARGGRLTQATSRTQFNENGSANAFEANARGQQRQAFGDTDK